VAFRGLRGLPDHLSRNGHTPRSASPARGMSGSPSNRRTAHRNRAPRTTPTPRYARGRVDTSFPHTTIRYRDVNSGVQVVSVM
jgi:hypothetical protein